MATTTEPFPAAAEPADRAESEVTVIDALRVLSRIDIPEAERKILASFISRVRLAHPDNQGLPCTCCDQRQPRYSIQRGDDDVIYVRISTTASAATLHSHVIKPLQTFAKGAFPKKPTHKPRTRGTHMR